MDVKSWKVKSASDGTVTVESPTLARPASPRKAPWSDDLARHLGRHARGRRHHGTRRGDGQLDAVLLGLRLDTLPATAHVTNEHGRALCVQLPRDVEPFSLNTRVTLTVEVTT
ncbi:hypothetical protein [Deinococcus sp. LM3]|uniref:hypothetical protein n=1 Tax=Deinococcus sp. LM3 TaxID=1938608 RepID=UPI00117C247F|nr:hypothetical protein [Deinococcus sp. LM3]